MRAMTQQQRNNAPPVRRGAAVQSTTTVRLGAGNRHRQSDAYEREADQIARFILQGVPFSRDISRAPAASYWNPSTSGFPLGAEIRNELEERFDADFSSVRIHADVEGAAAARSAQAFAFTSGPDIYFDSGRFAPHTEKGLRLLAHELVHVLQQTGRLGSRKRRVATRASGVGPIQRQPDDYSDDKVDFLSSGAKALEAVTTRHLATTPTDESLKGLVQIVRAYSAGWFPLKVDSVLCTALIEIAKTHQYLPIGQKTTVALTPAATGFLLDCLKLCAQDQTFEAAAVLLEEDTTGLLKVTFGPRNSFREFLKKSKRGDDWAAQLFTQEPFKRFWSIFFNTWAQYVLNPFRPVQPLYGFADAKKAAFENINGEKPDLLFSDRVLLAFELLERVDDFRQAVMSVLDKKIAEKNRDEPVEQRNARRPNFLREFCDIVLPTRTLSFEIDWFRKVRGIAQEAERFWLKVSRFQTSIRDRLIQASRTEKLESFVQLDRPFAEDDPAMAPLRKTLLAIAQPGGLFFLDASGKTTTIPEPADYGKRVVAISAALDFKGRLKDNFLLSIQQVLVRSHAKGGLDSPEALALGWVLSWMLDFQSTLSQYSPKKDVAASADGRLAHRYRIANQLLFLGQAAHWADLRDIAARIMRGEDRDVSYLAVPGQWLVEEDIPITQMESDFPGDLPFVGYYGLRPSHLSHFFHGQYFEALSNAIGETLKKARQDPKETTDIDALNKKVKALVRPWRCVPDSSAVVVLRDEDLGGKGKANNRDLIYGSDSERTHSEDELSRLSRERGLGPNPDGLALSMPPVKQPIFAWIVPDFVPLISQLKQTDPFKSKMTEKGFQSLNEGEWLEQLIKISGPNISADILKSIDAKVGGQYALMTEAFHQLTALLRRLLSRDLEKKLKGYRPVARDAEIPKDVTNQIWQFQGQVEPQPDINRPQALLILGLADALESAFPNARRAVKIPPYFLDALNKTLAFIPVARQAIASNATADQRKFVDEVLFKNDVDPARSERIEDFLANEQKIIDLIAHMEEARNEMQEEYGFQSIDGETLQSVGHSTKLTPGPENAMEIDGDDWELVEVATRFTYHPELDFSAMTSRARDPILKDKDDKPITINKQHLATFLVNGNEMELIADDTDIGKRRELKQLSRSIFNYSISKDMGELADTLEAGAMFMIDVMELIPAIGQEMMIARLGISMITFAGEIPHIAAAIKEDPIEYVKTLADRLTTKYLDPENIILFSLLGKGLEPLTNERKPAPAKTGFKPKGKLARALNLLRRLGMWLADALRWIRLRAQGPVRALESSLTTRPKLGWLLNRAVDIAFWLAHVVASEDPLLGVSKEERMLTVLAELIPVGVDLPDKATKEERQNQSRGLLMNVKDDLTEQGNFFKNELELLLQHLVERAVPKEIIPLDRVMAWIIDFFLSRLGAKVRMAKRLLEHTDVYQKLVGKISSALGDLARGTKVDPNYYWQTIVLDNVDSYLLEARNRLVAEIFSRTRDIADFTGIDFLRLPAPATKKKGEYGLQRADNPMIDLQTMHGEVPRRGQLAELPLTPGRPLAAAVRLSEERRFGHDFRHVRLHTAREPGLNLENLRANALTSGSHVFMRPGLDPKVGDGAKVLRHELTHVLQQTGPRPRGTVQETRPVRGRSKKGITVDQMREAAADAMARVDSAAVARKPIEVNEGAEGIQPSFEDAVGKVLNTLTTVHSADDFDKSTGGRAVPGEHEASAAWTLVKKALAKSTFQPFITGPVQALIVDHIVETVKDSAIAGVANLAQKPAKGARGKKPKNTELDFDRFVTLLEGYIFAKSGVAMQLKLSSPPSIALKSHEVTYVHFGVISPTSRTGSPLWDKVLKSTPGFGSDDPAKLRAEIFARLAALGPDPFVWNARKAEFRFSEEFVEAFNKVRVSGRRPDLDKKIPKRTDYLDQNGSGEVGLKLGTHKGQKGLDRESHHTTQYLLVQYFRNNNSVSAWRSGVDYPGIKPAKGKNRALFQAEGRKPLQLESLDSLASSRGAGMPAILISADLHRRGQLHIERESRWNGREEDPDGDDAQGPSRQGFAIDRVFKKSLKEKFGVSDDSSGWASAVKAKAKPDALIHDAMVDTYKWMRSIMLPALERGLLTREFAYYRGIAARSYLDRSSDPPKLQPLYDLRQDDMRAVHGNAVSNNDKIMTTAGWN